MSKIVGYMATPFGVMLTLLIAALAVRGRLLKNVLLLAALSWCAVTSCPWVAGRLALQLERQYPPVPLAQVPEVDVIHVLGGGVGVGGLTNEFGRVESDDPYNLGPGADRVTMGARVWRHLGGRPTIVLTGPKCALSTLPFLMELGVDTNRVIAAESPRTTEEEARWMDSASLSLKSNCGNGSSSKPKVLVVTTAIHMRRAMMLYRKYASSVEAIPMPTDYSVLPHEDPCEPFNPLSLLPTVDAMGQFNGVLHEYLGYWARAW